MLVHKTILQSLVGLPLEHFPQTTKIKAMLVAKFKVHKVLWHYTKLQRGI